MKKSTLYLLVIVASVALAGLIAVQAYWINNAYTIKEQQFAQLVNTTINRITEDVQSYEVVQVIHELSAPYPFQRNVRSQGDQRALLDSIIAGEKRLETPHSNISEEDKYAFWNNAVRDYYPYNNIVQQSFMHVYEQSESGSSSTQISGSISTIVPSSRISPAERRAKRKLLIEETLNRIQRADYRLEDRIDRVALDYFIRMELEKSDIDQPFEYAVYDKDTKNKIYQSEDFSPKKENEQFRATLFPFDWFESQPYYLSLYFPKRSNYLFKSIGFMSFSSVIFTLIVICAFSATVYQMIRQKKVASIHTDFVNNITHELKTPISTISLASQMLNDKSIPNKSKNYDHLSSVIADESKRLSQQVEKILQMAIFDRGKIMLKFKELDMNELVNVVVKNMLIQIKNKNGQVTKHLDAVNSVAEVDEVHITNVLFNLMDNAIKYSKGRPDITISTYDAGEKVCVSIRDKGIGINKADQKRIFDQFYRVSTGNVHNVKGFGLGLAYVKNVIDSHQGTIQVESEPGQGTNFIITLHRKQPAS